MSKICQQFHLDKFSRNAEFRKIREVLANVQRHQSSPLFQPPFVHACTFKEHQNLFQQNKNAFSQHARALTYLLTSFFSLYQPVFSLGDIFL